MTPKTPTTEKKISPKTKLVETAADLVYRQGWNTTGINQILKVADIPKGSFYYYFESKEELGVAIIRYQKERLDECFAQTLLNEKMSGRAAIEEFFNVRFDELKDGQWRYGCPIGSLSNEVAASGDEKIADACRETMACFLDALAVAIRRGQKDGSLRAAGGSPDIQALLIASLWQGGLLLAKTQRSEAQLPTLRSGITQALL